MKGLAFVFRHGRNFRIQIVIAVLVIAGAVATRFSYEEVIAILIAVALVLSGEMINTIMEEVLDVIEPRYSEHVGRVKDVSAGVVLFFSTFAVTIGILTLLHHFL